MQRSGYSFVEEGTKAPDGTFTSKVATRQKIGLYDSRDDGSGGGLGLLASILVHVSLITMVLVNAPSEEALQDAPLTYVELAQALPRQDSEESRNVVEAPGPESADAPRSAPLSDANRRASTPRPSGDRPTDRPGLVDAPFLPGSPAPGPTSPRVRPTPQATQGGNAGDPDAAESQEQIEDDRLRFEQSRRSETREKGQETASPVDWTSAIQQAGKIASLGTDQLGIYGGEEGFAESGPISFETQWYEWGDYATSMIRKIRYHWYANMPALVRMGLKGVVVIRFTIERDGTITNIEILDSSTHPPFDFAAKKAIELSSPLQPLPADFPKPSERVTAAFYYNLRPPHR